MNQPTPTSFIEIDLDDPTTKDYLESREQGYQVARLSIKRGGLAVYCNISFRVNCKTARPEVEVVAIQAWRDVCRTLSLMPWHKPCL